MAVPPGVSLALSDGPLADPVSWTRFDDQARFSEITISRGRSDERSKTSAGTVTARGFDTTGALDPTKTSGLDPTRQAAVTLYNPIRGDWNWLFRGHNAELIVDVDPSENWLEFELQLVDALDIINDAEIVPDSAGNILSPGDPEYLFYKEATGDCFYSGQHVNDRILAALADTAAELISGGIWPPTLIQVAEGNVWVQGSVYGSRTSLLEIIDEACDAEGPTSTNRFITKDGAFAFRGRYYRWSPETFIPPDGNRVEGSRLLHWKVGDIPAFNADNSLAVFTGLQFQRGKENLINSVLITPNGIAPENVAAQAVHDSSSISQYGLRPSGMSLENLIMSQGNDGNTAVQEAKSFAHAIVENYAQPITRVNQVTFRNPPSGTDPARAQAVWDLICGVELSDLVTVHSSHPGGGGFTGADYFVEHISYHIGPLQGDEADVTLTLDLSPRDYYNLQPDSWVGPGGSG